MVKRQTLVWNYFKKILIDGKTHAICNYCGAKYVSHAGKMRNHLRKCDKCPGPVREQFKDEHLGNFNRTSKTNEMVSPKTEDDLRYFIVETDVDPQPESDTGARFKEEEEQSFEDQSPEDQYDVFGKFIASEIKNLKSEQHRREVKKAILQIFMDVYTEENDCVIALD